MLLLLARKKKAKCDMMIGYWRRSASKIDFWIKHLQLNTEPKIVIFGWGVCVWGVLNLHRTKLMFVIIEFQF